VSSRQKKAAHSFPLTDSGNAELIAQMYGDRLRFNHRQGRWLIWNEGRWNEDRKDEVFPMAKDAARARLADAASIPDGPGRNEAARWSLESESQYRLKVALDLAKKEPPLSDAGDNWDSDPFLLGVGNGVVDLRTGKLRKACPEDRMILYTMVRYDPSAQCFRFEQFLREVFRGDEETIRFIQRAIGYSLTGDVTEQVLFLCYGDGANGKSTFLETVTHILGAYAHILPFSSFERKARSGIPNDLASLVSKRFVTAAETSENVVLNEGRIKSLTGGDTCPARFLYGEWFSFKPTAKHWLAFNHMPRITDDSHGLWRRVRLIPFLAKFDGEQRDSSLKETLQTEASGILAWAVRGCLLWKAEGLGMPAAVEEATTRYQSECDPVAPFLDEMYESFLDGFVESATLHSDYKAWAEDNSEKPLSLRDLGSRLRAHGFTQAKLGHARTRGWSGLKRKADGVGNLCADTRTDADTRIQ
jgi:putative DNA primase/helicase